MGESTRYLLVSKEKGVYLGSFLGLGFFSQLDSAGQDCAPTFESEDEIHQFAATWWDDEVGDVKAVPILSSTLDEDNYASMEACVAVGQKPWEFLDGYAND